MTEFYDCIKTLIEGAPLKIGDHLYYASTHTDEVEDFEIESISIERSKKYGSIELYFNVKNSWLPSYGTVVRTTVNNNDIDIDEAWFTNIGKAEEKIYHGTDS